MKTTFQDQTLYMGDFFHLAGELEPGSADLVLTDPPCGCIAQVQPWDIPINFTRLGRALARSLKPTGQIAIFANFATGVDIYTAFRGCGFEFRFPFIWEKYPGQPVNLSRPISDVELILVFKRQGAKVGDLTFNADQVKAPGEPYRKTSFTKVNPTRQGEKGTLFENTDGGRHPRTVLRYPSKPSMRAEERTDHPTQKPVDLLGYLLRLLSNPGDTVLDPFTGSGSTLVACHRLGRKGTGFEIELEYFELAKTRLERETSQGVLL